MTDKKDSKYIVSRDFKGVWIPKELYLMDSLTATEKMLLAEIDSLDTGRGCYASDTYLAGFLGITVSGERKMLTRLRKAGLVETVSFDGRLRFIKQTACAVKRDGVHQNQPALPVRT